MKCSGREGLKLKQSKSLIAFYCFYLSILMYKLIIGTILEWLTWTSLCGVLRWNHPFFKKNLVIEVLCAIWYHLYSLKNSKNYHGVVLLLVKLQDSLWNFTKNINPSWAFYTFFKIVQMMPNRAKRLNFETGAWMWNLPMQY